MLENPIGAQDSIWPKPNHPLDIHCCVDASWSASSLHCGLGWWLRDSSALVAETLAMRTALTVTFTAGYRFLSIFLDSRYVVTFHQYEWHEQTLKSILHDIHCVRTYFASIFFSFIPKSANVTPDALAKLALVPLNTSSPRGD